MVAFFVELDGFGDVEDVAVNAGAEETFVADAGEDIAEFAFAVADERGEEGELGGFAEGEDLVNDLTGGLRGDGTAALVAVGFADAGVEEAEVLVDFGGGGDGGAGVGGGGALFDGDGGGKAFDVVNVGFLELFEELAGVGGEALDVFALTFGVDGVKSETGFTGTAQAGDDDELVARQCEVNVLEVVLPGAGDDDGIFGHGQCERGVEFKEYSLAGLFSNPRRMRRIAGIWFAESQM